jgi:crossover junction endodeoxyribonuclease RuvC
MRTTKSAKESRPVIILAIDPATNCGFATKTAAGVWDLNIKKDESRGMKLIRFRAKLREIIQSEGITLVVFERPAGMHKNPIITQSELMGVIKLVCEDAGLDYRGFSAPEIKKFATGKGNCNKEAMVEAAQRLYGMEGTDDNIADALHLLHLAQSFYPE